MNKNEIQMFKHQLSDYKEYERQIEKLKNRLKDIYAQRQALLYPRIKYGEPIIENADISNVYMSDQFQRLKSQEDSIMRIVNCYEDLLDITDSVLSNVPSDAIRQLLMDIYVNKRPIGVVVLNSHWTDDKSVYRAIRNELKKFDI